VRSEHPVFLALGDAIKRRNLPLEPFRDLLSAFRQDAVKQRYETWDEVLDYCKRSANPVGRLVLLVTGQAAPELLPLSDALCTGLQLANFWQDLSVDLPRGRCYVPRADAAARFGVDVEALARGETPEGLGALIAELADRTGAFFEEARALPGRLRGLLRVEIAATWLGGSEILDQVEELGADLLTERPVISPLGKAEIVWKALRGRV